MFISYNCSCCRRPYIGDHIYTFIGFIVKIKICKDCFTKGKPAPLDKVHIKYEDYNLLS